MKCSNIKTLLSEYIDETLNAQTRFLVEEHLLVCKKCQDDHASLKNIISELGELPKVNAPDDFLENLRVRMESRFDLKQIMRTLFVPFKIKIPLELLTATATAAIIIFFINIFQQEKSGSDLLYSQKMEMSDDSFVTTDKLNSETPRQSTQDKSRLKKEGVGVNQLKEKSSGKTIPKIRVLAVKKEKAPEAFKSTPSSVIRETRAAYGSRQKRKSLEKPIELALLLNPETITEPAIADLEKKDQTFNEAISKPNLKKEVPTDELAESKVPTDADRSPLKSENTEEIKAIPAEPEAKKGMSLESDDKTVPAQSPEKRIKSIIHNTSGRIISVQYNEQTNRLLSILADIPSSQLKSFYSQLNQIGRIKQPLSTIDETKTKLLRINILLISSP